MITCRGSTKNISKKLVNLVDEMMHVLPSKKRLLLITIPDFAATPTGKSFGDPNVNTAGIQRFNQIIKDVGKERGIVVIDIFSLSQNVVNDPSLIALDGLHPSGKEYKEWEKIIYPAVYELLLK